jgi:hypothetical protein
MGLPLELPKEKLKLFSACLGDGGEILSIGDESCDFLDGNDDELKQASAYENVL